MVEPNSTNITENSLQSTDNLNPNIENNSLKSISFSSVSFFPYGRGFIWYAMYLLILTTLVYFSLKYSAPLFSAILVFASGLYLASTLSEPVANTVQITDTDLLVDAKPFPLKNFESFWIEPHGLDFGFLHIYKSKQILANKEIPYLNINSELLREFMNEKLKPNNSELSHSLAKISHVLKI